MDLYSSVKNYLSRMIGTAGNGMKVLLLDESTTKIISLASSMSEIMKNEVYLVERIENDREMVDHLKCVCFVRPTKENIGYLCRELKKPSYFIYYLFFSHALTKQLLKELADSDEHEVVAEVHEYFADFLALSPFTFELDLPVSLDQNKGISTHSLTRCTDGITAVLLALKQYPIIRYQNSSEASRNLAESIRSLISREAILFDFKRSEYSPVLLIIDRRCDPVTPLLTQWTYEAMIHELIGIRENRVNMSRTPNIRPELKEISLSTEYDEFYRINKHANFGEIGQSIRKLIDQLQHDSKLVDVKNIDSVTDLKKVFENYPAFRKASGTVETHVALVSELSRLVKEHALLEVSEAEQELVCHENSATSLSQIRALVKDPRVLLSDAVRLVLLYALRYENQRREIAGLTEFLVTRGASEQDIRMIDRLLNFSSQRVRTGEPSFFTAMKSVTTGVQSLNGQSASSAVASLTKRLVKGFKGIDNVYTQHEPVLREILEDLVKGKLRENAFPYLPVGSWSPPSTQRPKRIIVFFIGGATYEEVNVVHKLNSTISDVDFIIGATCMHNSRSFLDEVHAVTSSEFSGNKPNRGASDKPTTHPTRSSNDSRKNVLYTLLK